jgi:putative transposase
MKLHRQAHVVYKTQYHIVWITKYRRKILVEGIDKYFKLIMKEVREFYPDIKIEEIGVEVDHVHLHIIIPPKYAVSQVVGVIKGKTSKMMREKFSHFFDKVYWDNRGVWGRGFFVSTVGINEAVISRYVKYQGEQDTGQTEFEL